MPEGTAWHRTCIVQRAERSAAPGCKTGVQYEVDGLNTRLRWLDRCLLDKPEQTYYATAPPKNSINPPPFPPGGREGTGGKEWRTLYPL